MNRTLILFSCAAVLLQACVKDDAKTSSSTGSSGAETAISSPSGTTPAPSAVRVEIAPSLERSCRQICDRTRQLKCANVDKCFPNCLAMGSATPCTDEVLGFYECLVGQPLQNWECAPDGVAAIRKGLCNAEQGRTIACMETKLH